LSDAFKVDWVSDYEAETLRIWRGAKGEIFGSSVTDDDSFIFIQSGDAYLAILEGILTVKIWLIEAIIYL